MDPKSANIHFTAGIKTAALDPFRGYANAIRDELPEAITVLDAFHVVKLGSAMVDEVRRRVQQDTLGHRGRKGDPLYAIRRTLQIGAEHLTDKQAARLDAKLAAGTPTTKSLWPGSATKSSGRSITPDRNGAGNSSTRSSHHSRPARSRKSPASAGPSNNGRPRSSPTSTPTAPPTGPPKQSTASSKPPAESPAASATSPTTESDAYSQPAATAPTGSNRPTMPKCEGPEKRPGYTSTPLLSHFHQSNG
jgi:hypothetical protein